mgnify:CR=1 FL=1
MDIIIKGEINSLTIDGKEYILKETPKKNSKKNLADEMLKHEGVKEYNGIVETIQRWYYNGSFVKMPWCATALSYFANVCGLEKQIGKHENVDRLKDFMKKNKAIHMSHLYGGSYTPKRGDVIFFSSKHIYADCTHVGTVVSVKGDLVEWIGGNTSDSIKRKTNNLKKDKYVVCFGEVDYS